MRKQFINYQLVISLGLCSVFVFFAAALGVLHFRQEAFRHANNLKKIEAQCGVLESETLLLLAKIAQMRTAYYLKGKLLALSSVPERVFHVREWDSYKGSHMTRNALAMNIDRQLFQ
jgi:hypothetical protein